MKVSEKGLALIARFEGKRLTAYRDSVGVLTVGFGHTSAAGNPVVTPGMTITDQQAIDILRNDVAKFEGAVNRVLKREPTQNQFDAMVSLCYNVGPGNFGGSTVLADFNAGDMAGAALAFLRWVKAGGQTLPGLVARRQAERAVFETPDSGTSAVPVPAHVDATSAQKPPVASTAGLGGVISAILNILTILFARKAAP